MFILKVKTDNFTEVSFFPPEPHIYVYWESSGVYAYDKLKSVRKIKEFLHPTLWNLPSVALTV